MSCLEYVLVMLIRLLFRSYVFYKSFSSVRDVYTGREYREHLVVFLFLFDFV